MLLIRHCKLCEKEFRVKPSQAKLGRGKYCSVLCQRLASRTGKTIKCNFCGKEAYKQRKDIINSKSGNLFCSRICGIFWHAPKSVGKRHPNWKGGEYSYKNILERKKIPKICISCNKNDPRFLVVHHLDSNRQNNSPKNLVWICRNCHHLVHHYHDERNRLEKKLIDLKNA